MKRNILTVIIGAVLVVIFALLLFVFQVRQSEVAVVTTFGKPTAQTSPKPGAYFKWPWPIQKVYKFDQRIQNFEDKFSRRSRRTTTT
jgi:modulator of FtsH protease HflC